QMQQFINQQAETQCQWNAHLLETINQKLAHMEQPNINNNKQTESNPNNIQLENNQQRIINSWDNNGAAQGNYPPTPIINSLLMASGTENQGTEPADNPETITYKATSRKFPSFIYTFEDSTHAIQEQNEATALGDKRKNAK
ncbi:22220_t:CDS:2, partial [Gigaspora rosea]